MCWHNAQDIHHLKYGLSLSYANHIVVKILPSSYNMSNQLNLSIIIKLKYEIFIFSIDNNIEVQSLNKLSFFLQKKNNVYTIIIYLIELILRIIEYQFN